MFNKTLGIRQRHHYHDSIKCKFGSALFAVGMPEVMMESSTNPSQPNKPKPWLIALLAAIVAITPLAIDMYLPTMAAIASSLNAPLTGVQQSLSLYLAGYACGLMLFGPLADKYGRRPLVLLGLTGFGLVSFALAQTTDLTTFLGLRFLQAMLGSAATVAVPGYVKVLYGAHTAKGMSYVSLIMMLAPLVAPGIGSLILHLSHWQMVFYLLAGYAALMLIFLYVFLHIPETKTPTAQWQGFFHSYKQVLCRPGVKGYIGSGVLTSFAFFCYLTASPQVFMQVFSLGSEQFALVFAANVCALMLANVFNTRIVMRYGSLRLLRAATLLGILFAIALLAVSLAELGLVATMLCIMPLMGCLGIMSVNADAIVLMKFHHETGTATAVIGTLRFGAGALAGPLLAALYNGSAVPFAVLMLLAVVMARFSQTLSRSGG